MTAEEHYTEAERLLEKAFDSRSGGYLPMTLIAAAQVHATLAYARFQQVKR